MWGWGVGYLRPVHKMNAQALHACMFAFSLHASPHVLDPLECGVVRTTPAKVHAWWCEHPPQRGSGNANNGCFNLCYDTSCCVMLCRVVSASFNICSCLFEVLSVCLYILNLCPVPPHTYPLPPFYLESSRKKSACA